MRPSEIEKSNLEAHVELCAERYNATMSELEGLQTSMSIMTRSVEVISKSIVEKESENYRKLIRVGVTVIGSLFTTIISMAIYIISKYIIP